MAQSVSSSGALSGFSRQGTVDFGLKQARNKDWHGLLRYRWLLSGLAGVAMALVTLVCLELRLDVLGAETVYLILIALMSALGDLIVAFILNAIAFSCLDFLFAPPVFTFEIQHKKDFHELAIFLISSLVVTTLLGYARKLAETRRQQVGLLDLARDSVIAHDINGVATCWNFGAEQLYGWKRTEAIGKSIDGLLPTVFPVPLDDVINALGRTGHWEGELNPDKTRWLASGDLEPLVGAGRPEAETARHA